MFSIEVQGLAALRQRTRNLPKQFRFAGALALNDVAFEVARQALPAAMERAFVGVTPFIKRSPWYSKATPQQLVATIGVGDVGRPGVALENLSSGAIRGGKRTVDPANVLRPEVQGGKRKLKRSEVALQRIGILPQGYAMVPGDGAPRDAYGNVPGSFMVQLLSYFQAFGEQGYRANMTAKRKQALARGGRRAGRFQQGVEYFVSYGKLRSRNPNSDAEQPLRAGIWARYAFAKGSAVKPVFLFVRVPSYRQRLQLEEVVATTARARLPRAFHQRLQSALSSAR